MKILPFYFFNEIKICFIGILQLKNMITLFFSLTITYMNYFGYFIKISHKYRI